MREEIKTLIVEAESSVTEFEKEIFVNDRGFYMNAKTMIDDMIEQIMLIKQTADSENYNEEIYNANKYNLQRQYARIDQEYLKCHHQR